MESFYVVEQLGPKQSLTPDGFLLCSDVPIARTGTQIYREGEVPVEPGADGLIKIIREDAEVFRPETIASFNGKPVTLDHPPLFVTPDTWRELAIGVVQNARRGEGFDSNLLIADLLITDAEAIKLIRPETKDAPGSYVRPLREVSCGYDANYVQDTAGVGYQREIIGNHVALVERGRAGPRCSIQDSAKEIMTTPTQDKKPGLLARLLAKLPTMDADQLEQLAKDTDESDEEKEKRETKDSIAAIAKTVDGLAAAVAQLAKTKDADEDEGEEGKTDDNGDLTDPVTGSERVESTSYTGDALKDVIARAEILAPGIQVPTADSAAGDVVVNLQRAALSAAMKTEDGKRVVSPFLGGRELGKMTADGINAAFIGASELAKQVNNSRGAVFGHGATIDHRASTNIVKSMNEAAKKLWSNQ